MAQARVGIDVGGTFTDAVLVDSDNRLHIGKVASTPSDISVGFVRGLDVLEERSGIAAGELTYLAHGTTVATNAIVQRRLARSGLITNDGFRDLLEIGTQQRAHIYDLWTPEQPAVISREHCHGVRGRIAPDGSELQPLSEDDVRAAAAALREAGAESVAVVLLFSFLNPAHERRVRRILAAELPGVPVTLSCEVAPEIREYLRASTTALNASLLPLVGSYLGRLAEVVAARGVAVPVHLMCSNGGLAAARAAAELPVALATSGPAAGVIGAARLGALAGESDLLTFDMGGTTADVAVVIDGRPEVRHSGVLNGHPVNLSQLDVLCVGAGGGSLARVDEFGALLVGPQSAGASPARRRTGAAASTRRSPTPMRCSARSASRGRSAATSPSTPRPHAPPCSARSPDRSACRSRTPPGRSCGWPTPIWPPRCAWSPSPGAMTRAGWPWSRSAARARCTAVRSPRSWTYRACSSRRTPA
ncbi:hypothetical protein C7M71_027560 [Peterkaempfera bronchialis]|uniref:Hydantoinase/oxoprolinase n=1 Tax=Peterkaempfera bronchialis TaxID=2126346 RepID=A0A345T3N3_9ACTN|nr:hypothetical protein C7M71_027560 [Peterkaempfera bronchialis]